MSIEVSVLLWAAITIPVLVWLWYPQLRYKFERGERLAKEVPPLNSVFSGCSIERSHADGDTLTDWELVMIQRFNACPDCRCTVFRFGPSGGVSQNIECSLCGSRFNYAPSPFPVERISVPHPWLASIAYLPLEDAKSPLSQGPFR